MQPDRKQKETSNPQQNSEEFDRSRHQSYQGLANQEREIQDRNIVSDVPWSILVP